MGTDPLTFTNYVLELGIENSVTHEKFPLYPAQMITTVESWISSRSSDQIEAFGLPDCLRYYQLSLFHYDVWISILVYMNL